MKVTFFAALTALQSLSAAAPTSNIRHARHERRDDISDWVKRDAVPADFILPMRIALTQGNLDKGHDMLMDV